MGGSLGDCEVLAGEWVADWLGGHCMGGIEGPLGGCEVLSGEWGTGGGEVYGAVIKIDFFFWFVGGVVGGCERRAKKRKRVIKWREKERGTDAVR